MRRCPVCEKELIQRPICDNCGFDFSRDYEGHRTLCSALPKGAEPVSVCAAKWKRQKQLVPVSSDGLVCPKCGGQQFYFLADELQFLCIDCEAKLPVRITEEPKPDKPKPDEPTLEEPKPEYPKPEEPKRRPMGKLFAAAAAGTLVAAVLAWAIFVAGSGFLTNWGTSDDSPSATVGSRETQGPAATPTATLLNLDRTVGPTIAAGAYFTVGLKSDGTVVSVGSNAGGRSDVGGWTDIVAVAAGDYYTLGLKTDGTVVAIGDNTWGQCDVGGWTDIVAVAAGFNHAVGLRSDGTAVAVGVNSNGQCNVAGWTGIVAISAGYNYTVGLKSDGTVVAVGDNGDGQCNVSSWTGIAAISGGWDFTVGLKTDGTVVAVGKNDDGQCNVDGWTDIAAVAAGGSYALGLKTDGTVVAVGWNDYGQCDVGSWTDIAAVAAGDHTVGLKTDGTVVAIGQNYWGECDVDGWTDILLPGGSNQGKATASIGHRNAEARLMSMTPAELGLPGTSMSQYEVFPQNETELVNGMPCIRLEVYNSGDGPDPYVFASSYLMSMDGARLYKLDPITDVLQELEFTSDP